MIVCPVVVGSGKRFYPDGVRLDIELEERRFRKGVIVLRYAHPPRAAGNLSVKACFLSIVTSRSGSFWSTLGQGQLSCAAPESRTGVQPVPLHGPGALAVTVTTPNEPGLDCANPLSLIAPILGSDNDHPDWVIGDGEGGWL